MAEFLVIRALTSGAPSCLNQKQNHTPMKFPLSALALASLALPHVSHAELTFLGGASLPDGGEIVSYANGNVFTTNSGTSHAIQGYSLSSSGAFTPNLSVDLNGVFGGAANIYSVSSVYADARGFGVATVIPMAKGMSDFGRIAIFDTTSGAILKTLDVGYHPDSVTISGDGTRLLIANEAEYGSTSSTVAEEFHRPGSVSVVNISSVTAGNYSSAISALTSASVSTYDFSPGNLGSGVTIDGLRNPRLDTTTVKSPNIADIEPEYITATATDAYITLQEANAIAVLNFETGKYTAIHKLGSITKVIDASDRDGAGASTSISITSSVRGLPMPDTITKFSRGGKIYLATANEGDARPDDGDILRASQQGTLVNGSIAPSIDSSVLPSVTNTGIGRLNILKDQGDTDGDGDIDQPTAMGTRGFSIWDSETGELVFDSGSMIEEWVASNDPSTFNINSGSTSNVDTRSDDKGPEIEAIAFGSIDGRDYLFVGAERQNGIFQIDITDLNAAAIVGYFNTVSSTLDSGGAFISPESIVFLSALESPTGAPMLLIGDEGTGGNGSLLALGVTAAAVPEPSTYALIGLGVFAFLRFRGKK